MVDVIKTVWSTATGEGGVLRVRGLLALGVTGVALAMFFQGKALPNELLAAWVAITGIYFGSRIASP